MTNHVIAIDFDGTLYLGDTFPEVFPEKLNFPLIKTICNIQKTRNDIKFILWTCRTGKEVDIALQSLDDYNIRWDAVNDNLLLWYYS